MKIKTTSVSQSKVVIIFSVSSRYIKVLLNNAVTLTNLRTRWTVLTPTCRSFLSLREINYADLIICFLLMKLLIDANIFVFKII